MTIKTKVCLSNDEKLKMEMMESMKTFSISSPSCRLANLIRRFEMKSTELKTKSSSKMNQLSSINFNASESTSNVRLKRLKHQYELNIKENIHKNAECNKSVAYSNLLNLNSNQKSPNVWQHVQKLNHESDSEHSRETSVEKFSTRPTLSHPRVILSEYRMKSDLANKSSPHLSPKTILSIDPRQVHPACLQANQSYHCYQRYQQSSHQHKSTLSSLSTNKSNMTPKKRELILSLLLPAQIKRIPYSIITQRMLCLLNSDRWFCNGDRHQAHLPKFLLLRTLEKGAFFPVLHIKRISQQVSAVDKFLNSDHFGKDYVLEQRAYVRLHCISFPKIHDRKSGDCQISSSCSETDEEKEEEKENGSHLNNDTNTCSENGNDLSPQRPTSVLSTGSNSNESEDSGCLSMESHTSGPHIWMGNSSPESGVMTLDEEEEEEKEKFVYKLYGKENKSNELTSVEKSLQSIEIRMPSKHEKKTLVKIDDAKDEMLSSVHDCQSDEHHLFAESIRFLNQVKGHFKSNSSRMKAHPTYVPIQKYLLRPAQSTNEMMNTSADDLNGSRMRCHLIVGFLAQSDLYSETLESNWWEQTGARFIAVFAASRFGLRRISFLKRKLQDEDSQRLSKPKMVAYSHLDRTFDHVLHAVFCNVSKKQVPYLQDFVFRFRSRNASHYVNFYTTTKHEHF